MARYDLAQFVQDHREQTLNQGAFELESERVLEVNLDGMVWTKAGSMIAYRGQVKFERESLLEQGFGTLLKKAVSGEGAMLTKATGKGKLYLADGGKRVSVLQLNNESLFVNGGDVLAFTPSLRHEIKMMRKLSAIASGGLFNIRVEGAGLLAITTHGKPLVLAISPDSPVFTDPQATVAWSGSLTPEFKTDVSLRTFLGRGSGESFQMAFQGSGFVVVQPYEESPLAHPSA